MSIAGRELRVLHIEVSEDDAFLARRALERGGLRVAFARVASSAEFERQLKSGPWDIVLCDYEARGFGAREALQRLAEHRKTTNGSDIPFILLAGCIGEENTADIMRHGARDYINKNKLTQLVPAVERELIEARIRHHNPRLARDESGTEHVHIAVFEASPDPILVLDNEGTIIELNPTAFNMFSTERSACLGRNITELGAWRNKPQVESIIQRHQSGVLVRNEALSLTDRDQRERLLVWSIEEVELSSTVRVLWFGREVTQMRESEHVLQERRKNEALSTFGAGVAKDLQQAFSDILVLAEGAAQQGSQDEVLKRYHYGIQSAAVAGRKLVRRIGTIARRPRPETPDQAVPLCHLVRETVLEFERHIPENISIRSQIAGDHLVAATPASFQEMLTNILSNAANAMASKGGHIHLRAEDLQQPHMEASPRSVKITVRDNGPGIKPEHLTRVMDPYFTTKPTGGPVPGVGLGLSVVQNRAAEMGGTLSLDSMPGEGCTVTLVLPVAASPDSAGVAESSESQAG